MMMVTTTNEVMEVTGTRKRKYMSTPSFRWRLASGLTTLFVFMGFGAPAAAAAAGVPSVSSVPTRRRTCCRSLLSEASIAPPRGLPRRGSDRGNGGRGFEANQPKYVVTSSSSSWLRPPAALPLLLLRRRPALRGLPECRFGTRASLAETAFLASSSSSSSSSSCRDWGEDAARRGGWTAFETTRCRRGRSHRQRGHEGGSVCGGGLVMKAQVFSRPSTCGHATTIPSTLALRAISRGGRRGGVASAAASAAAVAAAAAARPQLVPRLRCSPLLRANLKVLGATLLNLSSVFKVALSVRYLCEWLPQINPHLPPFSFLFSLTDSYTAFLQTVFPTVRGFDLSGFFTWALIGFAERSLRRGLLGLAAQEGSPSTTLPG
eukprot:GHVU01187802.1.p1 GENE.GHVU01187802.1~~GHVU01187802.1.p1  ORF type:complete len:377 (-),score=74.21 GHVU01187802.1:199-1329(-)